MSGSAARSPAVAIAAYTVEPQDDDAFLAAWHAARAGVLHRALRPDVDFRFVEVAGPGAPGPDLPFPAHAAAYDVAHEDGEPDGSDGVILVNAFEVAPGDDDAFLAGWGRARALLADQRGYLGTRLHRAASAADLRFVNLARWSSPLMFSRAVGRPEFVAAAGAVPFASHPGLYQVVATSAGAGR